MLYVLNHEPGVQYSSIEEQTVLLAEAFRREQGTFMVLFMPDSERADLLSLTSRGLLATYISPRIGFSSFWKLSRLISHNKIEIVHWNFTSPLKNLYVWGLRIFHPTLMQWFTDHSSRPSYGRKMSPKGWRSYIKKTLLSQYSKVFGVSRYVVEDLREQNVWPEPIVFTHFVNTDRF